MGTGQQLFRDEAKTASQVLRGSQAIFGLHNDKDGGSNFQLIETVSCGLTQPCHLGEIRLMRCARPIYPLWRTPRGEADTISLSGRQRKHALAASTDIEGQVGLLHRFGMPLQSSDV